MVPSCKHNWPKIPQRWGIFQDVCSHMHLHVGVLFLEVELNILLVVTGTPLEIDVIRLEIVSANTKDYGRQIWHRAFPC